MDNTEEQILSATSFWEELTAEEKATVLHQSALKHFAKDEIISSSDSSCTGVVFVISGGIRISIVSDEGREITLYRLETGDCCVTTASCVIRQITFDTVVSSSAETVLMVIPSNVISYLMNANIYFRAFIYETEAKRFSQVIWVMQELLFKRFDQRLAAYLLSEYESMKKPEITLTQEEIARNVNSAREVVARMLKHFSSDGLVEIRRGHVVLKDIRGLRNLL